MKKLFLPVFSVLLLITCSSFLINSNNNSFINFSAPQDMVKNVDPFTSIGVAVKADVYYSSGNKHEVRIEGEEKDLKDLKVIVEDGTLFIKYKPGNIKRSRLTIHIVSQELDGVKISGSAVFNAEKVEADEMDFAVSGSGKIIFKSLESDEVEIKISGSGDVILESGSADECDALISGSGKLLAESFTAGEFSAKISGSGSVKITVTDELEAAISGSGSVYYHGSPRVNTVASGSGKVRKL